MKRKSFANKLHRWSRVFTTTCQLLFNKIFSIATLLFVQPRKMSCCSWHKLPEISSVWSSNTPRISVQTGVISERAIITELPHVLHVWPRVTNWLLVKSSWVKTCFINYNESGVYVRKMTCRAIGLLVSCYGDLKTCNIENFIQVMQELADKKGKFILREFQLQRL